MLFAVLSAGCVEESMDTFHAIALHQPLPCALEEQTLRMDGTKEQTGNAASVANLPCCYLPIAVSTFSLYGGQIRTFHCKTRNASVFDGWLQPVFLLLSLKSSVTVIALYLLWIL